jgi:hypothetical protein
VTYDRRAAVSPFAVFVDDDREAFVTFVRRLTFWMGNATPINLTEMHAGWRSSATLQHFLAQHVNPASATLYYGKRWETHDALPALGTKFPRRFPVLQWSLREKTATWFAGLPQRTSDIPHSKADWLGGVLVEAQASKADIIVDVDRFSVFCGQHRREFEALDPGSDALSMFNGTEYEGEVLTTRRVQGVVVRAELF